MANEKTRPLKVFLCHASGDKLPVRDLYKRLVAEGVDAWLDQEKLLPGQDWRVEIPRAVRESDVVVICLSNKSITKEGYIQKEIKFALDSAEEKPEGTIFLIPARLEDCAVPDRLSGWQWVDLFEENGFARLLRSLKLRAAQVGARVEPTSYADSDKELERRLEQLYTEGLAAFYTEDWDKACRRFQSILSEQPNHKRAAEKLAEAERQRRLAKLYAEAAEAIRSEDWESAIQTLEELSQKSATYKDVAQLLGNGRKQKQLRELYAEAKTLHSAQKWQAVIKVFEQISVIEPQYPDPHQLLTSAQKEATELKRLDELNDLYTRGVHKMDEGQWYEARDLLEQVHKAEIGFLETERLLRKVENEILKIEELNKRNIHINTLYEQAHGMVRSKNWRKALDKLEEIQKLDDRFADTDGIFEKAKTELEREELEVQRQQELGALYAEAVSLLEAKKYQEALEKWNAIQVIDPQYKDRLRVKKTAKRKLDELSRPEAVGRPWSKLIGDWISSEANIPFDRQIFAEKLLLLSFVCVVIIHILWEVTGDRLQIFANGVGYFVLLLLGLYGLVVAVVYRYAIYNWGWKSSLILIVGWTLGSGVALIAGRYFAGGFRIVFIGSTALSSALAMKWAKVSVGRSAFIFIFWALAWWGGQLLGDYLGNTFSTGHTWAIADALAILLGLLFTFGLQVEKSSEVLKTALISALGFAVGNFIAYLFSSSSLMTKIADPIGLSLWGIIGGAILEAPSRDARRILFSAGLCGMSLLLGYAIASVIYPAVAGLSSSAILRYQVSYGIGLGLGLGLLIRRASAMGILVILGVGIFIITRALNVEVLDILGIWENIVRGALIGLVLGYGYGYMRKAQPLQNKSGPVIAKRSLIGIIVIVTIAIVMIAITLSANNGASRTLDEFTVRVLDETCPIYPAETDIEGFVSESNDLLAPWSGTSVQFQGTDECTNREMLGVSSLIYRYQLKFNEVTQLTSIAVSGAAFNGPDSVLRVLDENKNILGTMSTFGGNSFRTHVITLQGVEGRIFFVDEFDTSTTWRLRQKIVVNGHFP